MKFAIYLLLLLVFLSCTYTKVPVKRNINSSTVTLHEGEWYSNFKNEVFIRSLKKFYPQSFTAFLDSSDASSSANIDHLDFNPDIMKVIDSLAGEFSKRRENFWTIGGKNVTLNNCINFRNSSELDAIAVFFYKKFHPTTDKHPKQKSEL